MNLSAITQTYLSTFPYDSSLNPIPRQTPGKLLARANPVGFPNAVLIDFNEKLSLDIGLGSLQTSQEEQFLHASFIPSKLQPYATAYAGHQFGQWAGQLGDGRALFAGEITNHHGQTTELQWKGAGLTPYSRHADGRAVLRSTVREYLMSEAMHHLKIPTTRALALSLSGEAVIRDILYSGNPKPEPGAVMMRTAPSFLRFGHFELLAAQRNLPLLSQLADFTIQNYFPEIQSKGKERYLDWFYSITEKTAHLITQWQRVGFVHGVMNTDNMSILGLTIDYGPFAIMEEYNPKFTSNTTDLPGRRYAFGQQENAALWNLWQLANALFPLIGEEDPIQEVLSAYDALITDKKNRMLCDKFGFNFPRKEDPSFFQNWQNLAQELQADHTLFFILLEEWNPEKNNAADHFEPCFYKPLNKDEKERFNALLALYSLRVQHNQQDQKETQNKMQQSNPKFVLRNYLLHECSEQLAQNDNTLFKKLKTALQSPYENRFSEFAIKRPDQYTNTPGCTMLSCSS
ncbi:protein adenylyltransferase SelO [Bergeyella sp. RCAD1439]|uniref:protein adenylyltransferase SelO n=1 Tax=Bergeyella anatis TaxID=3113737 RepID=UPI002E183E03|nr:YdiU family protein [Bergeyella sp. RCAD1439]